MSKETREKMIKVVAVFIALSFTLTLFTTFLFR